LTRDPASAVGEYGYCLNNPEGYTDQSGCVATATPEGTAADNPTWENELVLVLVRIDSTDPEAAIVLLDMVAAGILIAVVILSGGGLLAVLGIAAATTVVHNLQDEVICITKFRTGDLEPWAFVTQSVYRLGFSAVARFVPSLFPRP